MSKKQKKPTKNEEILGRIAELRGRLLEAYRSNKYQSVKKKDLAKKHRKPRMGMKKMGWKEDALGYRSAKVDRLMWGKKNTDYGNVSCWVVVCGWELHLVKITAGDVQKWYGLAHGGGKKVIRRKVMLPTGTHDAKALNEMFRERLKITFKV